MLKHNSNSAQKKSKFTSFFSPFKFLGKNFFHTLSFFNVYKQIKYVVAVKNELQQAQKIKQQKNISNDSDYQDAQQWIKYSKDMSKKGLNALLYIFFVALWLGSSLMLHSVKIPFWVLLLQLYFLIILIYYFIMCRYRVYQGNMRAKKLSELKFIDWFSVKIKRK